MKFSDLIIKIIWFLTPMRVIPALFVVIFYISIHLMVKTFREAQAIDISNLKKEKACAVRCERFFALEGKIDVETGFATSSIVESGQPFPAIVHLGSSTDHGGPCVCSFRSDPDPSDGGISDGSR